LGHEQTLLFSQTHQKVLTQLPPNEGEEGGEDEDVIEVYPSNIRFLTSPLTRTIQTISGFEILFLFSSSPFMSSDNYLICFFKMLPFVGWGGGEVGGI